MNWGEWLLVFALGVIILGVVLELHAEGVGREWFERRRQAKGRPW